jgi:hypothetical protein
MKPSDKNIDKYFEKARSQSPLLEESEIGKLLEKDSPRVPLIDKFFESIIGVRKMQLAAVVLGAVAITAGVFSFGDFNGETNLPAESTPVVEEYSAPKQDAPEIKEAAVGKEEPKEVKEFKIVVDDGDSQKDKSVKKFVFKKKVTATFTADVKDVRGVNAIELSEEELAKIGVTIQEDEIVYYYNGTKHPYRTALRCNGHTNESLRDQEKFEEKPIHPVMVSDTKGISFYQYDPFERKNKFDKANKMIENMVGKREFNIESPENAVVVYQHIDSDVDIEEWKKKYPISEVEFEKFDNTKHGKNAKFTTRSKIKKDIKYKITRDSLIKYHGELNDSIHTWIEKHMGDMDSVSGMTITMSGSRFGADSTLENFEMNIDLGELIKSGMSQMNDSMQMDSFVWATDHEGIVLESFEDNPAMVAVLKDIDSINADIHKFNLSVIGTPENTAVFTMEAESPKVKHFVVPHEGNEFNEEFTLQKEGTATEFVVAINAYRHSIDNYMKLNKLIPIRVNLPDCENHYILWYEPTDDFLEALPEDHRERIKKELHIFDNSEDVCRDVPKDEEQHLLDLWRSCSGAIENFTVFPNPTSGNVNVSYDLKDQREIIVAIHDLDGRKIKELSRKKSKSPGKWTENYNISDLEPGMYLLSLQTNSGAQAVQRIILK